MGWIQSRTGFVHEGAKYFRPEYSGVRFQNHFHQSGNREDYGDTRTQRLPAASRGGSLPADASKPNPKPYELPVTSSGMPASYSFTVDLVIFGDGTTWGSAKLEVSEALLMRLAQEK